MTLRELLHRAVACADARQRRADADVADVTGIAYDSRQVKPGAVFVALRGVQRRRRALRAAGDRQRRDRRRRGDAPRPPASPVPWIAGARRARWRSPSSAAEFYGNPSEELALVGITGTNGKTTTSYVLASIFEAAGIKCGRIGTVGYRIGDAGVSTPRARRPKRPSCSGCCATW